jgi:hypothetical protein
MNSFIFLKKKMEKLFSRTCRYYVGKRYKCDRKRDEKGRFRVLFPGAIFDQFSTKKLIKKSMQKLMSKKHENNCKRLPKWNRNRCQNDQKSMPELVSKKIREIIKNHVSLKSEIIEIHWKNNGF